MKTISPPFVVLLLTTIVAFLPPNRLFARGLMLENVTVPETGLRGESETLRCDFQLGSDTLYSLKWYKDDKEFYRIVTNNHQQPQVFSLPGVKVAVKKSNLHQVVLTNLSLDSSGVYRCEISAETSFRTVSKEGNLTVIVPPERLKPTISNISNMYHMGDTIEGNCTSYRSSPAANLSFHIHDNKVDGNSLIEYRVQNESGGLETSVLGLRVVVAHQHFLGGVLKLKCTAAIGKRSWQEHLVIEHRNFYHSQVASAGQRGYSAGTMNRGRESLVSLISLFIVAFASTLTTMGLVGATPLSLPGLTTSSFCPHSPSEGDEGQEDEGQDEEDDSSDSSSSPFISATRQHALQ